jgi:glyoxylase-like metal-dependent hydrolase (beta-lactamase superfamily II)
LAAPSWTGLLGWYLTLPGGVGHTQGDAERFQQLKGEVSTKIFDRRPDDTWFHPGHGNDSTLGAERPHLGEWRARGR